MRSVVVTGGTVRLGKAIADRLTADGWRVLTTSHRPDSGADIIGDLTFPDGADRIFNAACGLCGGVPDAWVNNAALFVGSDVNVRSVNFESPRRFIELMSARGDGYGAVVNILDAQDRAGEYGRSKLALREYGLSSAVAMAGRLRVNAVAPGPVLPPVEIHEKAAKCPLGRPTPESVASAVAFLLESRFTTGCIVPVDGGAGLLV